jgi:hypothetical protein
MNILVTHSFCHHDVIELVIHSMISWIFPSKSIVKVQRKKEVVWPYFLTKYDFHHICAITICGERVRKNRLFYFFYKNKDMDVTLDRPSRLIILTFSNCKKQKNTS